MSSISSDQALGIYLKTLRVQAGFDVAVLARRLSLSPAQLMQLENGQASLFYNHRIRQQAARKVIVHLGGDPSHVDDESVNAAPADEPIAVSTPLVERKEPIEEPPPVAKPARQGRQALGALALFVLLVLGSVWMAQGWAPARERSVELAKSLTPKSEPVRAAPEPAAPPETAPLTVAAVDIETPPAPAAAASAPTQVVATPPAPGTSDACADPADPAPTVRPPQALKAGDMVYVVSTGAVSVCVTDGSGKQQRKRLAAGQSHSFYGPSPWIVRSDQLRQTQLYFQGWRVRLPAQAQDRVKLVEVR